MARSYQIDGKTVPSVTTVLQIVAKPFLTKWILSVGQEKADQIIKASCEYGKAVHLQLEKLLVNGEQIEDPSPTMRDLTAWVSTSVEEVLWCEKEILCPSLSYGGTADCLVKLKSGKTALLDWKTSKGVYKDHHLQVAAYNHIVKADEAYIVHLPKDGRLTFHEVDCVKAFPAFVGALELFKFMNP